VRYYVPTIPSAALAALHGLLEAGRHNDALESQTLCKTSEPDANC